MNERAATGETNTGAKADHFSSVAASYAAFRPHYPTALFDAVVPLARHRRVAWDCAAGTGQATLDLARRFDRVIATDVSASQISQAPPDPKIEWRVAPAETSGIAEGSVDFVGVGQALHWFDQAAFYAEVRRVSTEGAVLAVWSYGSAELAGDAGAAFSRFEHETMGAYWPPERRYVLDVYATIEFPFEELPVQQMTMEEHWTRDQTLGYVRTWSAVTRYQAKHGADPVAAFANELERLWPNADERRTVRWPLAVRAGRINER